MPTLIAISVSVTVPGRPAELRCRFWTTFCRRAARHAGVVGAADPDRAEGHAVGADAAAALGARHTRLPIGVPVAPERFGHPV